MPEKTSQNISQTTFQNTSGERNLDSKMKKAVALTYDGTGAPRVTARGTGELAKKIIEVAQAEGIPIQSNEALVDALIKIDLHREIPPQLYAAVAEILALIYKLDKRKQEQERVIS